MSIEVVRAFVQMRKISSSHEKIAEILRELEDAVSRRLDRHDKEIQTLFKMMAGLIGDPEEPLAKRRIGTA